MSLLQLYYTSVKYGVDGRSGTSIYRVYAASPGCDQRLCQNLTVAKHTNYYPPDKIETLADAPIAFSYYRLSNGEKFISQVLYKGMVDNSNRQVPFCHFIVDNSKEPGFAGTYPVQFWESPNFWNQKLKNTDELPPETTLPGLEQVVPGHLSGSDVPGFLSENNRIEKYPEILTAVETYFAGSSSLHRRIIISDTCKNVAGWINAVTRAYPLKLAEKITFTTYNFDPGTGCDHIITGTTKGAKLESFSESNQSFYMFDFFNNSFSRIDKVSPYALTVLDSVKNGNTSFIEKFCNFCDGLKSEISFDDLMGLLVIYILKGGGSVRQGNLPRGLEAFKKLSGEPGTVIQPIAEAIMHHIGKMEQSPFPLAQDLLRWSNRIEVPSSTRDCIAREFLALFLEKTLPTVSEQMMSGIAEQYRKTPHSNEFWESIKGKISKQIENATDVGLVVRLIKFADMLKIFPLEESTLTCAMEKYLLPSLTLAAVQQCTRQLIEKDKTGVALNSLYTHLRDNIDREDYFAGISGFLKNNQDTVLQPLIEKVRESGPGLSRVLVNLQTLSTRPRYMDTARFRETRISSSVTPPGRRIFTRKHEDDQKTRVRSTSNRVANLRDMIINLLYMHYNEDSPIVQEIKQFIDAQWGQQNIMTDKEIAELISDPFLPILLRDGLGLAELFLQMLVRRNDLVSFTPEQETAMKSLRKSLLEHGTILIHKEKYATLNSIYAILSAIDAWEDNCPGKELDANIVDHYLNLLGVLPEPNSILRDKIIKHAVQMLVRKTIIYNSHYYSYDMLYRNLGETFVKQYDDELMSAEHAKDITAEKLATIFKTLHNRIKAGGAESLEQKILDGNFKVLYSGNEKRAKELKKIMSQDVEFSTAFNNWLGQEPGPPPQHKKRFPFPL